MCYQTQLEEAQPQLEKYISKRIFDKSDAADVVQEVNLVAINKESEYDDSRNFNAWVNGLAKFQIMAYLKRKKRNKIFYIDKYHEHVCTESLNQQVISVCNQDEDNPSINHKQLMRSINQDWMADAPFAELIKQERLDFITQINNILGPIEKLVVNLLINGLDNKQVAEETGMKVPNIQVAKSRAIAKIKKLISHRRNTESTDSGWSYNDY